MPKNLLSQPYILIQIIILLVNFLFVSGLINVNVISDSQSELKAKNFALCQTRLKAYSDDNLPSLATRVTWAVQDGLAIHIHHSQYIPHGYNVKFKA